MPFETPSQIRQNTPLSPREESAYSLHCRYITVPNYANASTIGSSETHEGHYLGVTEGRNYAVVRKSQTFKYLGSIFMDLIEHTVDWPKNSESKETGDW